MADITEAIHKISYEVNKDALDNATKAIQLQLAELDKLGRVLASYNHQLQRLAITEGSRLEELGRKTELVSRRVAISSARAEGVLKELFKGISKGFDIESGLSDSIAKYVEGVRRKFEEIGTSANAVSHGVSKMFTSTSSASKNGGKVLGSIEKLGKSLSGTTGLIDLAITALGYLGEEFLNEGSIIDRFINGEQKVVTETDRIITSFTDLTGKVSELAAEESVNSKLLYKTATDINLSYAQRLAAVNDLQSRYPEYFGNLSKEAILAGEAAAQYEELNKSLIARAQIDVYKQELQDLFRQQRALERNAEITDGINRALEQTYDSAIEQGASPSIKTKLQFQKDSQSASAQAEYLKNLAEQEKISSKILEIEKTIKVVRNTGNNKDGIAETAKVKDESKTKREQDATYLPVKNTRFFPVEMEQPNIEQTNLQAQEEKQKGLTKEQRENIIQGIDSYKQLAQAAADAYNKILQVQIDTLDKEISIREKRVEEAKKLAERGNVEALRIEEERLRKAQEQRAKFARQQQAVNAAITVSNAIAAVARAALEGGGFGSAATIAALIAALAAGYAAVTSMSADSADSFADGVVDYKGKGGPRDDKNWVRISNGESVITAEGTKKHKALLEAINKGARLQMMEASLPFVMPMFKQPALNAPGQYAAAKDMQRLETKLDEVVGAIEDNKLRQDIFFNEQGVGIMTEKAIQRSRNRWK